MHAAWHRAARSRSVIDTTQLNQLDAQQLREMVRSLMAHRRGQGPRDRVQAGDDRQDHARDGGAQAAEVRRQERGTSTPSRRACSKRRIDADLAALQAELDKVVPDDAGQGREEAHPSAQTLPANLPRREIHHEPENTTCSCGCAMKRIGEDVAEKLDYQPGVFTRRAPRARQVGLRAAARRWCRRRWPPHVIDKGMPTTGLLAQVLVAKFLDHLPLYRQERIFERAGLAIARSTLAQWVGECGAQLQPLVDALSGRAAASTTCCTPTRRRWRCSSRATARRTGRTCGATARRSFNPMKAVVFDFADSRAGQHARDFLGLPRRRRLARQAGLRRLSGYKALLRAMGVTEAGCLAHARRKFHELWANHKSQVGRAGAEVLRPAVRGRARGARRSTPTSDGGSGRARRKPMADALQQWLHAAAAEGARRLGHRQGHRLQPQSLGGADALPR